MAEKTLIAWTDYTFNPWMGCTKVSEGCRNCYAATLTKNRMGLDLWGPKKKRKRTSASTWQKVYRWNKKAEQEQKPKRVFCASLADVFEDAPELVEYRMDLWEIIRNTPWLDWQLLTKRPQNIEKFLPSDWGDGYPNVWLGTSIEDNRVAHRGPILTSVPAIVHFVSYEPAIGPLDQLDLTDIEWLIYGGESGPGYRDHDIQWARDIRKRCEESGTAFFYKQSPAYRTEMGIELDGEIVRNYPKGWDRAELREPLTLFG